LSDFDEDLINRINNPIATSLDTDKSKTLPTGTAIINTSAQCCIFLPVLHSAHTQQMQAILEATKI
jgi:hypothetical protein